MKLCVVVSLHGDEPFGVEVMEKLSGTMPVIVGNPKAIERGVRYIDSDLNRAFPGNNQGNYEERRAAELTEKLKEYDYVIDVHSSVCDFELFGIILKPTKEKIDLAKKMGLKKLVVVKDEIFKGQALIEHVKCGISLEVGPHERENNVEEVTRAIRRLMEEENEKGEIELFEVFDIIKGDIKASKNLANFKEVKKGETIAEGDDCLFAPFDFVPIFVGEQAYEGVLCLAARKISEKEILS